MALQGNLRDFSATEILQLLGTQKKTGCLTLEHDAQREVVYVADGRVVSTRTPGHAKDDPLLAFLRSVHRLSDEQQRGILTIQRESGRDLEDLLVNGRSLEAEELSALVERQILETMMRVARWEDGTYRFDPHLRWPQAPLVRLNIEAVLMEVARRADEQKRYAPLFSDPHRLLGVRDLPDPDVPLGEEEREIFGIVDGQHTVREVIDAAPLTEYEACETLQRMVEAGWIELMGRRDPGFAAPAVAAAVVARQAPRSWAREVAVAAAIMAAVGLLRVGALVVRPRAPHAQSDVFASAQVRDIRLALDLYHREHGVYPARLEELQEARWVEPEALDVPGHVLSYHPRSDRLDYSLELAPDP